MINRILETPAFKKGSSRAKWFTVIKCYDNKPVDAFVEVTTKKNPVLMNNGEPESPQVWVRSFAHDKLIELI